MRYKLIRFFDKKIGIPLCLIFYLISNILLLVRSNKPKDVKKILIIRFWGIGSLVLLSPTLEAIRKKFCNSNITLLTLCQNREVYEENNLFDKIICLDLDNLLKFPMRCIKLIHSLYNEHYEMVIDFEQFCRFSSLISFLTFSKIRIGFNTKNQCRGLLYNVPIKYDDYKHVSDAFFDIVRIFYSSDFIRLIKPQTTAEEKYKVDILLKEKNIKNDDLVICFNINCGDYALERRWPKENFVQIADWIIKDLSAKIIFIGSDKENDYVEGTIKLIEDNVNVINLCGLINIRQLSYLFEKCTLLISNDSGPLHIGVASNIPTVSFFGPETPHKYGPIGDYHYVFYKNLPCSPCISVFGSKSVNCKIGVKCMKTIYPHEVYNKIRNILDKIQLDVNEKRFKGFNILQ